MGKYQPMCRGVGPTVCSWIIIMDYYNRFVYLADFADLVDFADFVDLGDFADLADFADFVDLADFVASHLYAQS